MDDKVYLDGEDIEDIKKDIVETDMLIAQEAEYADRYIQNLVADLKKVGAKNIEASISQSVPLKLPFKVKVKNFFNKLLKVFS